MAPRSPPRISPHAVSNREPGAHAHSKVTATSAASVRSTGCTGRITDTANEVHNHDRGLAYDLPRLVDRRRTLQLSAGAGFVTAAAAFGSKGKTASSAATTSTSTAGSTTTSSSTPSSSTANTTTAIPDETAGPYPGDGSPEPDLARPGHRVQRRVEHRARDRDRHRRRRLHGHPQHPGVARGPAVTGRRRRRGGWTRAVLRLLDRECPWGALDVRQTRGRDHRLPRTIH